MFPEFPGTVHLPARTLFGKGAAHKLARETLPFGSRGLIIFGGSFQRNQSAKTILSSFPRSVRLLCRAGGEPTLRDVENGIALARKAKAQWVAGIGGGSVLDLAKAVAGLCRAKHPPVYYQEGGVLERSGVPFIAVPTTAGTGSEATVNAVITNPQKDSKLSIRDNGFLARAVVLDPDLLAGLPKTTLSYSGMDAFVQAYEAFTSKNATAFTDLLALRAVRLVNENIVRAYRAPDDASLSAMLIGSYYAGVALAHARLGVIHGLAHPLGVLYRIPHGLVCAACLLPSISLNRGAMGPKYDLLSEALGADLYRRSASLLKTLNIPRPFRNKRIIEEEKIIAETLSSGSTAANPLPVTRADVQFILKKLFA